MCYRFKCVMESIVCLGGGGTKDFCSSCELQQASTVKFSWYSSLPVYMFLTQWRATQHQLCFLNFGKAKFEKLRKPNGGFYVTSYQAQSFHEVHREFKRFWLFFSMPCCIKKKPRDAAKSCAYSV